MLVQKAFKYRLRTTPETEDQLRRMAGCRRFVWNHGLAVIKTALNSEVKIPRYSSLCSDLIEVKKHHPFLAEDAVAQALQQTLKDLDKAVKDAFDPKQPLKEFPVFKKKGISGDSFRIPQGFQIDENNSRIKLPKLGWLRYRNSRQIEGIPKNVTISKNGKHWFISIQTEQVVPDPVHFSDKAIGIDRGISVMAALSDGVLIQPLNAFGKMKCRLARMQRQLSRKIKFSENWKKCKTRITKLHSKIAAMRKDYLHKISTAIAKNHSIVVLEDLKITNMTASAAGTVENPGKKVKQKAGLNRSILDQGWGEFARQLEYKLSWLGGKLVKIPPAYTSQTCNACACVDKNNRKGIRFSCKSCGHESHADINAARNILAAGFAAIACGEYLDVAGSVKQEPLQDFALAV